MVIGDFVLLSFPSGLQVVPLPEYVFQGLYLADHFLDKVAFFLAQAPQFCQLFSYLGFGVRGTINSATF
jgi:hypothetical protein